MGEISKQFIVQPFTEASEQTPAARQYHIAHQNLTQVRFTGTKWFSDKLWHAFWQVRVGFLGISEWIGGSMRERYDWFTVSFWLCEKKSSPTPNRSGPKYELKPVGNSYCLGGRAAAALCFYPSKTYWAWQWKLTVSFFRLTDRSIPDPERQRHSEAIHRPR